MLLAADGVVGKEIARVGYAKPTAVLRRRYAAAEQAPTVPEAVRDRVLTRIEPPVELGAMHWSSRLGAAWFAEDRHRLSQAPVA